MGFNKSEGIDLHIHSTASDGTFTPSDILSLARKRGLSAIAITDHDTVEGSQEALRVGLPPSVEFLTGVEISADPPEDFPRVGSIHILGYGIRLDDPFLNQTLARLRHARENRNPKMVERLNALGFDISLDDIRRSAGHCQLGRPHIARCLVERGIVDSIDQAFDSYLGNGRPAYVEKYRISWQTALDCIHTAGGVAVLAHPGLLPISNADRLEAFIAKFGAKGLAGIEVYYPEHTAEQKAMLLQIAERHKLLVTGGTDFHGDLTPAIHMGRGDGTLHVPYECFQAIKDRLNQP